MNGNEVRDDGNGILLEDSLANTISDNNVAGNNGYGVFLKGSSDNTLLGNNVLENNWEGIWLHDSLNNNISNNEITHNGHGIFLKNSLNNNVSRNSVTDNQQYGIALKNCTNNIASDNEITNNECGIWFCETSGNNTIYGNDLASNVHGIWFADSSNNLMRNNTVVNSRVNFRVDGFELPHFVNDVDVSNTVDGKPVYYWVNRSDATVPLDAGYVALVNCTSMKVENLTIARNGQGILLAYTRESTINGNNLTNNEYAIFLTGSWQNRICGNQITSNDHGVCLQASPNNTISENNITSNKWEGVFIHDSSDCNIMYGNKISNNEYGMWLNSSLHNTISENNVTENNGYGIWLVSSSNNRVRENNLSANSWEAIWLYHSTNNSISGNSVENNWCGVWIKDSSDNSISHNNFINNTHQVTSQNSSDIWDDGIEGNYWSNYDGMDSDHDGLANTPCPIMAESLDNHPLMGRFSSFNISPSSNVDVISNSTVEIVYYFRSNNTIKMLVTNATNSQAGGFCRLTIPHNVLSPPYNLSINNEYASYMTLHENETISVIYIDFKYSTLEIVIVPEFPSFLVPLLFMMATLLTAFAFRKKAHPTRRHNTICDSCLISAFGRTSIDRSKPVVKTRKPDDMNSSTQEKYFRIARLTD
jgi:parallel beta-helix repeat protein